MDFYIAQSETALIIPDYSIVILKLVALCNYMLGLGFRNTVISANINTSKIRSSVFNMTPSLIADFSQ